MERKVPKYENHKIRERKVKTLTRNWRDHWRIDTQKLYWDISTGKAVFINQKRVNVCEHMTKMASLASDAIFVVCSQTFTLFLLIKAAMPLEISRYSFCVFSCACPSVISSISGKSFHFPFPYFAILIFLILSIRQFHHWI